MSNSTAAATTKPKGFMRFFKAVERAGNKLPHPFFLFMYLGLIVMLLSLLFRGTAVTYEGVANGEITTLSVAVVNLLTPEYLVKVLTNWVDIYISFAPLGLVMVMMLSIGFAEDSGLFDAFMRNTLLGAPQWAVTYVLAVVCACGNLVSSAGNIISATLGAALFASLRRNPIIGAVTGYAACHGGYAANLILNGDDVLLAGITKAAAEGMGIVAEINPMMNYFFTFASTFLIAGVVTIVVEWVFPKMDIPEGVHKEMDANLSPEEKRGLKFAAVALALFVIAIVACCVLPGSAFRAEDGSLIPSSPLVSSVVGILFLFFVAVGSAYGVGSGTVKKMTDIPKLMQNGLKGSLSFFVIALPAALFIQFFNDSKLATIIAVNGANFLEVMNFKGIPLAIGFIFLSALINLTMTSSSAKWMILAPIFVPMFAMVGFSPALTQIAFRIGDTMTNPIAPINFFLPIVLGLMNQYKKPEDPEFGIGSLISLTLPFSIGFTIVGIGMLILFMLLGLPLGPGVTLFI